MDLIWAPHVLENLKDSDITTYLEFSTSASLPAGACNLDRALRALYQANGDIKLALEKLLTNDAQLCSINHDHATWTQDERQCFERLFKSHGKNFSQISLSMETKSVKECVEFYYLWKHSTSRNSQTTSPRPVGVTRLTTTTAAAAAAAAAATLEPPSTDHNNNYISSNSISSSNNSDNTSEHSVKQDANDLNLTTKLRGEICGELIGSHQETFPCKVCGRVFLKIKSRSAHMKRHKNER